MVGTLRDGTLGMGRGFRKGGMNLGDGDVASREL